MFFVLAYKFRALEIQPNLRYYQLAMIVTYLGEGSFRLQSGESVILIDPANNRQKATITIRTIVPANLTDIPDEEIALAGEYEIQGIEIQGFPIDQNTDTSGYLKTAYRIRWEDITIVTLGNLSDGLDPAATEALGEPDLLILPVGKGFLEPDRAAKLARALEPAIIIPSFSERSRKFAKVFGAHVEPQEKLVFKKKDVQPKKMQVVILDPRN